MEGKFWSYVFTTTQSRNNCRLHYKAISVALFASNLPIFWGSKTAHLHFLTGTTFAHLGLCLASPTTCRMTSTAVFPSVTAHTSKWANSHRCLSICTTNIKNSRGSSSTTRQRHQEAVCSTTVSEHGTAVWCVCLTTCWVSAAHRFSGGNWGQALGWIPSALFGQGHFEKELPQCFLRPPHEQATSDPPHSHQRPQIKIPALFR